MSDLIGSLLGGFWPQIVTAAVAVFGALGFYLTGRAAANRNTRAKAAERRLRTIKERDRHEREAETQDDPELVRRLTRRP